MNVVPPQSGTSLTLSKGETLRIVDILGEQVADVIAYDANDHREVLSSGRTLDYASSIALTTGSVLYSNRSRAMFTIVRDDVGRHDFLLTPCSRETFAIIYDAREPRKGCFEHLCAALAPFDIEPDAIPTTFNAFMHVALEPDGTFAVRPPLSRAGNAIELRAEMDLIVGLTACSAEQSNNFAFKPIGYEILPAG